MNLIEKDGKTYLREGDEWGLKTVLRELFDERRWSSVSRLVMESPEGGTFVEFYVEEVATEYQDEGVDRHEDMVEIDGYDCFEVVVVEPYEKTVTDYRPISRDNEGG